MSSERNHPYPTDRARSLRQTQTPPEAILWSELRAGRLHGFRFRRQHPIGPYVVDFACREAMLVVELDSSYHAGRQHQDHQRDITLAEHGWRVLRVTASQLANDEAQVLSWILKAARDGKARLEHREGEERESQ